MSANDGSIAEIFEISGEGKRGKPDDLHNFRDCLVHNAVPQITGLECIPSRLSLAFLDLDVAARPSLERILGRKLDKLLGDDAVIRCDCPPRSKHRVAWRSTLSAQPLRSSSEITLHARDPAHAEVAVAVEHGGLTA